MKSKLIVPIAACLLGLSALTYSVRGQATAITPPPTQPEVPGTQPVPRPPRVRHPAIHVAIGALERAKADLQAASHDFGGHRIDAINACDNAIAQLRLALQFANQNGTPTPAQP